MNDVDMWSIIVGFILPPVMAVVNKNHWSPGLKAVVVFGSCILASAGTIYITGGFDIIEKKHIISSFLLTFVTAISTYNGFWKPTNIAPTIEQNILK